MKTAPLSRSKRVVSHQVPKVNDRKHQDEKIDLYDFDQIVEACTEAKESDGTPTIIIARTVKGKGISYMESNYNWHATPPTDEDLRLAQEELAEQEDAL